GRYRGYCARLRHRRQFLDPRRGAFRRADRPRRRRRRADAAGGQDRRPVRRHPDGARPGADPQPLHEGAWHRPRRRAGWMTLLVARISEATSGANPGFRYAHPGYGIIEPWRAAAPALASAPAWGPARPPAAARRPAR